MLAHPHAVPFVRLDDEKGICHDRLTAKIAAFATYCWEDTILLPFIGTLLHRLAASERQYDAT